MLIIFDLDDTLIQTTKYLSPYRLKQALLAMRQQGYISKNFNTELNELIELKKTCLSSLDAIKYFLIEKKQKKSLYIQTAQYQLYYADLPSFCVLPTFPGVKNFLLDIGQEHTLCLVSLGDPSIQRKKMEKAGIDTSIFSKIIIAKRANKKKFYSRLMQRFNIKANEVYVCGDRIDIDLKPAKQLNCRTIWMNGSKKQTNMLADGHVDFTIEKISEIKAIIAKHK